MYSSSFPFYGFENPLGTFRSISFTVDNLEFHSLEQYLQFKKAIVFGDTHAAKKILSVRYPSEARTLGNSISGYTVEEWEKEAPKILHTGCKALFNQNAGAKKYLIKTGNSHLIHAHPRDLLLGVGWAKTDPEAKDESKWKGKNLLGEELMNLREKFQKEERHSRPFKKPRQTGGKKKSSKIRGGRQTSEIFDENCPAGDRQIVQDVLKQIRQQQEQKQKKKHHTSPLQQKQQEYGENAIVQEILKRMRSTGDSSESPPKKKVKTPTPCQKNKKSRRAEESSSSSSSESEEEPKRSSSGSSDNSDNSEEY